MAGSERKSEGAGLGDPQGQDLQGEGLRREVWIARGARRAEARLVAEVRRWHAVVRADPTRLATPLCVLVPSRSLKDHVSATLVREIGTLAGVAVQTHHGTALQILERAGRAAPPGAELVGVLVRQRAREVPSLLALEALDDGHGAVAAAVSDLLDAGLDDASAEAVEELLAGASPGARARAAGVLEVARAVRGDLHGRGLGRLGDVIVRAREAVEEDPTLFAPGHLLIHGFADVTGLVLDFLRTLVRGRHATVLLDRPPDPAEPEQPDLGAAFVRSLEEAMAASLGVAPQLDPEPPPPSRREFFRAPGTDAEVRAVVRRIEALLADGVEPESIAIVSRAPTLYAASLRVQLARFGIPASGVGVAGPRSALGRRVDFVLDLLRERERFAADRFVLGLGSFGPGQRADLRLGLHALGVPRLGDLASPSILDRLGEGGSFPLPVRRGLDVADEDEASPDDVPAPGPRAPRARRRHLGRELLERAVATAAEVCRGLASAEAPKAMGDRLDGLRLLLVGGLGWDPARAAGPLFARLETLRQDLPADLPVTLGELGLVLDRALGPLAHEPLGGSGGGVQLLDVIEARARTFSHLFLLGLNRDHFPRVVSQDPLLPDDLRREIATLLPELPVKERGHDEERFLFAELLSSSPAVTLSWQLLGDDGKARAPSPLVDRLLSHGAPVPLAPSAFAPPGVEPDELPVHDRPAHEWALLAGLHGTRAQAEALLPVALAEARGRAATGEAERAVAAVRSRAVAELDAYRSDDPELGPFFGHVGAPREAADLRRGELWVTHVEELALCPWRGFLTRLLRLERPPDALEALPEASPLLVGSLVHAVLERIVRDAVPEAPTPERLSGAPAVPVGWPEAASLERMLRAEAVAILREAGIGVPGFATLLAEHARAHLLVARERDWARGPLEVVAAEVTVPVQVPGPSGPRTLWFRADRVDRDADGALRLTDYKTGKPPSTGARAKTRSEAFEKQVTQGRKLQAAAYARTAPGATGRFLFLKPDLPDATRELAVGPDDEALDAAFVRAVAAVSEALDEGTFVPRLVDAKGEEPSPCGWCELSVACVRGDSGARRRVSAWAASAPQAEQARARALRGIWSLGDEP